MTGSSAVGNTDGDNVNMSVKKLGVITAAWIVALMTNVIAHAQAIPYKLGMFAESGRAFVGLVLDDAVVVDLTRADDDYPATLRGLIEIWDDELASDLMDLAEAARERPPAYAFPLDQLATLVPLADPEVILMAARNYVEHAQEIEVQRRLCAQTDLHADDEQIADVRGIFMRQVALGRDAV